MSRWPPKRLEVRFGAHSVAVQRLSRGAAAGESLERAVLPPHVSADVWEAASNALEALIGEEQTSARSARVTLCGSFYKAITLPWQPHLEREADRLQYAAHRLARLYGDEHPWRDIRLGAAQYGNPLLAVATDGDLGVRLRQILAPKGIRIERIEPAATAVFNRHRSILRKSRCFAFAIAEPDGILTALVNGGAWQAVLQSKARITSIAELRATLQRELAALDSVHEPERLYYAADHLGTVGDLKLDQLESIQLNDGVTRGRCVSSPNVESTKGA